MIKKTSFHHFMIVLMEVIFFMAIDFVPSNAKNISTDESALLALKAHIQNNSYNILATNWSSSSSSSICNWVGITCGLHHNRVTALNLSYMGLSGPLPPHLGNLSFLVELDLRNNSFQGMLPTELANLRRLKMINLGFNKGLGGIKIPSWFGSFPELQYLGLYGNQFSGSIPKSIFNLSSIQVINLSYNQLHGSIPREIGNSTSLKSLLLANNNINGEFGLEGIVSTRGDVYSYGILLLETFTRKKPTDAMFVGEMRLTKWVIESLSNGNIGRVIDANLLRDEKENESNIIDCVSSILLLAVNCSVDSPDERKTIKEVIVALNKIKTKFFKDI